jgi:hypothetical protein
MKKLLKLTLRFAGLVLTALLSIQLLTYISAPVYRFSPPKAFSGNKLHNPYANMNWHNWRRYNFQVQSHAWGGITNGDKNSNELIDSVYYSLGYDYVATSDYQRINYHGNEKPNFIPTYEHGYNLFKIHQVLIGSGKVLWTDLMFGQTLSMKQWIIDKLRPYNKLIALAHPKLRNGYTLDNLNYLTHYDLMEVLNNLRVSLPHWDAALSSGQLVYILADDDAHDVSDITQVGRRFTMINSPDTKAENIIENLKKGNAYGVDFFRFDWENMPQKIKRMKTLPFVKSVVLNDDTLTVTVNRQAGLFRFIGQNGAVKHTKINSTSARYVIKPDDSYIRTEVIFKDSTRFYLNPIVRYSGDKPHSLKTAVIDKQKTFMLRVLYFIVILLLFYIFLKRGKLKNGNG